MTLFGPSLPGYQSPTQPAITAGKGSSQAGNWHAPAHKKVSGRIVGLRATPIARPVGDDGHRGNVGSPMTVWPARGHVPAEGETLPAVGEHDAAGVHDLMCGSSRYLHRELRAVGAPFEKRQTIRATSRRLGEDVPQPIRHTCRVNQREQRPDTEIVEHG